jgi:DNA-directed RNA polymerase specialized sigma24 family protein
VVQQEAVQVLNSLLERMPPDYAGVIRHYDLEERPVAEVAAALGRSAGAVYMLRARAHDLLRELLLEQTDFLTRAS